MYEKYKRQNPKASGSATKRSMAGPFLVSMIWFSTGTGALQSCTAPEVSANIGVVAAAGALISGPLSCSGKSPFIFTPLGRLTAISTPPTSFLSFPPLHIDLRASQSFLLTFGFTHIGPTPDLCDICLSFPISRWRKKQDIAGSCWHSHWFSW